MDKIITQNKKINHLYKIKQTFQAGIVLFGDEVKAIKTQKINLQGSYIKIKNNQAYLTNIKIPLYKKSNINTIKHEQNRDIKILLSKKEIIKLKTFVDQKTYTIIPTKVYLKNNLIKIEIAIACGKKKYDKREYLKKRDLKRKINHKFKLKI